jgi:carbon monoxide dehydrogenase subunit G
VTRVEDVYERERGAGSRWTEVLETASGRGVRAEFRCRRSREPDEYEWEQEIEDTPFAKVFKTSVTTVALDDADGGTRVTLQLDQDLRGLSVLGGFMMKRASRDQLEAALDGLERALAGDGDG